MEEKYSIELGGGKRGSLFAAHRRKTIPEEKEMVLSYWPWENLLMGGGSRISNLANTLGKMQRGASSALFMKGGGKHSWKKRCMPLLGGRESIERKGKALRDRGVEKRFTYGVGGKKRISKWENHQKKGFWRKKKGGRAR